MTKKQENAPDGPRKSPVVHCWDRLRAAVGNHDDPWRTPSLATSGPEGPGVRTVVLRAVNPDGMQLDFHTDCRSEKFAQLAEQAQVAWMFYDASVREQLRCDGPAEMHQGNAAALDAWKQLHPGSRKPYAQSIGPGDPWQEGPSQLAEPDAFANFVLVRCTVRHMDWLQLADAEHVRIRMNPTSAGWRCQRVAP